MAIYYNNIYIANLDNMGGGPSRPSDGSSQGTWSGGTASGTSTTFSGPKYTSPSGTSTTMGGNSGIGGGGDRGRIWSR